MRVSGAVTMTSSSSPRRPMCCIPRETETGVPEIRKNRECRTNFPARGGGIPPGSGYIAVRITIGWVINHRLCRLNSSMATSIGIWLRVACRVWP